MLGNCSCFCFCLLTFFKIKFLEINHPGPPSVCQKVWIQIKTDILLVFIWVQTVCKRLLADDKIIHWHAKSYNRGKFNNASALGRSFYWCQALHIMDKDRYQSTSARRALALLNSPQVNTLVFNILSHIGIYMHHVYHKY